MVVFLNLLTGNNIKKSLNVRSVSKRWHNKNKSGGNFGFNIVPFSYHVLGDTAYEFTGYYNTSGEITSLTFGKIYEGRTPIINKENYQEINYQDAMKRVNELIAQRF